MKDVRLRQALLARRARVSRDNSAHFPALPRARGVALSRRRFMQGGATVVAAGVIGQVARPQVLEAADANPVPVPGSTGLAPFSIWAPVFVDSIDADPASITNFNGVAGLAYLTGTVRRTNRVTNEVRDLPFIDADMRFMQGVYRGVDGKPRQGTFGFV
jgi:hypothetical protein